MASAQLLAGRLAVVTGGGSGIGRAVCSVFAREGAKVVIADIDEKAARTTLESIAGEKHQALVVNVTQKESVQNLFTKIQQEFSSIPNVVINCAGITKDGFMVDMTEQMFDEVIKVNLKGTYLVTQTASKLMIQEKAENCSIVNISSVVGKVGNIGQCNYAASKAGVEALTKTAAKELARYGIRCNAVMPGFIDTPMVTSVPDKVIDGILKQTPLKRMGKPEEVANVIAFLASNNSSYITGEIIQFEKNLCSLTIAQEEGHFEILEIPRKDSNDAFVHLVNKASKLNFVAETDIISCRYFGYGIASTKKIQLTYSPSAYL